MGHAMRGRGLEHEGEAHQARSGPMWERRRSFRVSVPARACIWHKGELRGSYSVRDVSIGGCALSGGPTRPVGEVLDLLLRLSERPALALQARVRRSAGDAMGVSFERTPPRAEDTIQDVVVAAIAQAREYGRHVALVVEPRHAVRQQLVRTLRELGQRAIGVSTALDAVQLLVEEGDRVDTAFIEIASTTLPSLELVEFLANNHPRVRRVLVGEPADLRPAWIVEATGEVHGVLETPCEREAVKRLLARIGNVPLDVLLS